MKKNKILTSFLLTAVLTTGFTGAFMAVNANNPASVVYAYTTYKYTTPTIMNGKEVVELQKILNGLGYDCGKVDGYYGKGVEDAIKKFQKDQKLPVDGICGDKTWNKLFAEVKAIQVKLNTLGFNCGTANGYFSTNTTNALKEYQKSEKIKETGICDVNTKTKLFASNSNENASKNSNDNESKNSNDNDNDNANKNNNKNDNDNANLNQNENENVNKNTNSNINNTTNINITINNNTSSKNNNTTGKNYNNSTNKKK